MTDATRAWLEGLRAHAAAARLIAHDAHDRPAAEAATERAVLAAHLTIWLDTELPGLLAERSAERGCGDFTATPTSTPSRPWC